MAELLYRLGRFSARRHWLVIATWIVVIGIAGGSYAMFHGSLSGAITIPGTPTSKVADELAAKFPKASGGSGTVVFSTTSGSAFTDQQKAAIAALLKDLGTEPGVKGTTDPFQTAAERDAQQQKITDGRTQLTQGKQQLDGAQAQLDAGKQQVGGAQQQLDAAKAQAAGSAATLAQLNGRQQQLDAKKQELQAGQKTIDDNRAKLTEQAEQLEVGAQLLDLAKELRTVSKDGAAAVGVVQFTTPTYAVPPQVKDDIVQKAAAAHIDGVEVNVSNDIAQTVPKVLGPGEVIGVVIAAIALFVMLGTLLGATLPLLGALLGVGVGVLAALSFSDVVTMISVTPVLGVMLGLAVGIDYALFILNRHRRQLKQGVPMGESIGLANGTSGNAVVFAGSTVLVALLALNVTGIPFLGLMGTVGAVCVAVAVLVAITLTPALLSLVGMRILSRKERGRAGTAEALPAVPQAPMSTGRSVLTLVAGVLVLGVIAIPAMSMRLGLPVGSSEAQDSQQYKAYKTVERKFGAGVNGPLLVVAHLPGKLTGTGLTAAEAAIGAKLAAVPGVVAVAPIGASDDATVAAFQVIPTDGPSTESTAQLVRDLRDISPLTVDAGRVELGVAGNASGNIDVSQKLADVLPIYLALVVGLSLIILIFVFRSILVPLTATAGFVLSLLAAFGGLTAIYQWGWLSSVFGVHDPAPVLSFLPTIEIGILFGLAMDYQLFLVSGMREAFVHGAPARLAVRRGLHAGRAVVTAAAIIMISVFAGFIFSESATIRPIGFGLSFGVLADAFIVRMLLIPAAMHLLGKSAWWLPKWLDRILPDVDVEGAKLERTHPVHGHEEAAPAGVATGSA
ncbi:MMPL family transporter [Dactylosporangium sp. NPDC049140]|uniref:MMPL family transporter n=1 Tax=Dactylosporangium sp. NPDC049140 TaxID=3155647 RepID=UPI0033D09BE2